MCLAPLRIDFLLFQGNLITNLAGKVDK
jgi:hypothetical protein